MSAQVFDLTARQHDSRVLAAWHAERGSAQRAGWSPQAAGPEVPPGSLTAEELMQVLGIGQATAAGVSVTPELAMRQATNYACCSLLAGAVASMPVGIYEREGEVRKPADHDYYWLFNEQANEEMSAFVAWQQLILNQRLHGDGIAQLLRPSVVSNRVIGWRPFPKPRVHPFRDTDGTVYYRVTPEKGEPFVLDAADVIHLPSLGFDGLTSPSPVVYAAREAIGTLIAAENYSGRFFNGGASFDYALKTASKLDKSQLDALYASLLMRSQQRGTTRAPLILTGGLEPAELSFNMVDAEIVALRLLGGEDICRVHGVPPHMVGHTQKVTSWGKGLEEQGASFVRYTLQNLLTPLKQEFNRKLWPNRARFFIEHITAALERGDLKARYDAYRVALGRAGEMPFMDVTEVRRLENMPPNDSLKRNEGKPAGDGGGDDSRGGDGDAKPSDPAAD